MIAALFFWLVVVPLGIGLTVYFFMGLTLAIRSVVDRIPPVHRGPDDHSYVGVWLLCMSSPLIVLGLVMAALWLFA